MCHIIRLFPRNQCVHTRELMRGKGGGGGGGVSMKTSYTRISTSVKEKADLRWTYTWGAYTQRNTAYCH